MEIKKLEKKNLNEFKKFLSKLKYDFVQTKKSRRNNPLEKYFTNPNLRMLLVWENKKIIGYVSYQFKSDKKGRIIGLGIDKNYRNKGIGKTLAKKALKDLLRVHNKVVVRTWSTNKVSISLIKKLGFKRYKTIKNQRVDGSDTIWFVYKK